MYSMILMAAMLPAGDDVGFVGIRGGCNGATAKAGCTGAPAKAAGCTGAPAKSAGCSGSVAKSVVAGLADRFENRARLRFVRGAGCSGSAAATTTTTTTTTTKSTTVAKKN